MHQTKRWHIAGLILADVCAQGLIFNQYFISVLFCELLEMLKTDHAKHKNLNQYIGNVWLFFTTLFVIGGYQWFDKGSKILLSNLDYSYM